MSSGLESHLGYWLRSVSNHVSHAFAAKVEGRGVTVAEWVVMRALLDFEEVNPSALAGKVGLTRGAVSKLMDRLEGKGLALIREGKKDKRYQSVSLSAKGRRLVPDLARLADENDHEFFGHLGQADRARVETILRDISRRQGFNGAPTE